MTRLYNNQTLNVEGPLAAMVGREIGQWHSKAPRTCVPRTKATQSLALSFLFFHTQTHTRGLIIIDEGLVNEATLSCMYSV